MSSIAKAITFMEDFMKEDISISDAADAASYSLYHFCRLFNRYVHHTPYEYLIRRRLNEAAMELKETDRQIIDIAFEYCFNSHENFSRAFKRFSGMQPNEWRKKGIPDRRFGFSRRTKKHLELLGNDFLQKPEFIENRSYIFAGISSIVRTWEKCTSETWDLLDDGLSNLKNIAQPKKYYSIMIYPNDWEKRGCVNMAAVEISGLGGFNHLLTTKTLPATNYATFSFCGSYRHAIEYIYQTYLLKSGKRPAFHFDIEEKGLDWKNSDNEWKKILIPVY